MSPASPQEVVAARKADRIAWVDYAEGKRNAYTAAAPLFTPVRLTNFMKDDGIMMSGVRISDDGSSVIFLRGIGPNRAGWSLNPSADPNGPETRAGLREPPAVARGNRRFSVRTKKNRRPAVCATTVPTASLRSCNR